MGWFVKLCGWSVGASKAGIVRIEGRVEELEEYERALTLVPALKAFRR